MQRKIIHGGESLWKPKDMACQGRETSSCSGGRLNSKMTNQFKTHKSDSPKEKKREIHRLGKRKSNHTYLQTKCGTFHNGLCHELGTRSIHQAAKIQHENSTPKREKSQLNKLTWKCKAWRKWMHTTSRAGRLEWSRRQKVREKARPWRRNWIRFWLVDMCWPNDIHVIRRRTQPT